MNFEVNAEVLDKILQYLATKPYQEVVGLIKELQDKAKPIQDKVEHEEG